ncbi:hypothetical protein [Paenibacillus kobensis]|uniref:hypothetical protein n=1 Tax=Paenibacillus kobensis TaxID=59841 RepID=UPI000FDACFCC|nr:hypothetical protein [Paenibacillus kobensis]
MTIKGRRTVIIIAVVIVLLIISILVSRHISTTTRNYSSHQVFNVTSHYDYAVSGDLNGLVSFADYIVTGHYDKFQESWNMGEDYYSDVYQFVIDEVNYGDVTGTISVAIPHYQQLSKLVDGQLYTSNIDLPNYTQPSIGQKYVLFLKKYEPKNIFTPAAVPFQIEIDPSSVSKLKYTTKISNKEVKTKSGDTIIFSSEAVDIASIDKISGLSDQDLKQQISNAVKSKKSK